MAPIDVERLELLLDEPETLIAGDRYALLRTAAAAGATVREMARLTEEAGLARVTGDGPPRTLLLVADPPVAAAADIVAALGGRRTPAPTLLLAPDAPLPDWVGPADLAVVAGRGVRREPVFARAAEALARRGVAVLGVGGPGGPLEECCRRYRAPYVVPPRDRAAGFWPLASPVFAAATAAGLIEDRDPDRTGVLTAVAAALDEVAAVCRPDADSFVNPGKTVALGLAEAVPVLVGDRAGDAVAGPVAARLAALAGWPAVRLPLAEAGEVGGLLAGPWAPDPAADSLFRDRLDPAAIGLRVVGLRGSGADSDGSEAPAWAAVRAAAERVDVPVSELDVEATGGLPRLAALLALGEFTAVFLRLGAGRGADPPADLDPVDLDRAD